MQCVVESLTLAELEACLVAELARVDASFQHTQIEARAALARDLLPGAERIAVHPLDIDQVVLDFALARVPLCWRARLWRRVRRIARSLLRRPAPDDGERYRFAAQGSGDVQVRCTLTRNGPGAYRADVSSAAGGVPGA